MLNDYCYFLSHHIASKQNNGWVPMQVGGGGGWRFQHKNKFKQNFNQVLLKKKVFPTLGEFLIVICIIKSLYVYIYIIKSPCYHKRTSLSLKLLFAPAPFCPSRAPDAPDTVVEDPVRS